MVWDNAAWKGWRLLAKLDPEKKLPEESFHIICHRNIDAVVVGGTQGVNRDNTGDLIGLLRRRGYGGPLVQEISSEDAVAPGVDAYFIPVVLNAGEKRWLVDAHLSAIKKYRNLINWDRVLTEGYLVCNAGSAVGRLTGAADPSVDDAVAYAVLAEEIFRLPLLYIEYSGAFGDPDLVRAVAGARKKIHLVYGGGIKTPAQLDIMASLADTVVVGNVFYENPAQAGELVNSFKRKGQSWVS